MTALEYMERQLAKHKMNYHRGVDTGVPQTQLDNIAAKIEHYQTAVNALTLLKVTENEYTNH